MAYLDRIRVLTVALLLAALSCSLMTACGGDEEDGETFTGDDTGGRGADSSDGGRGGDGSDGDESGGTASGGDASGGDTSRGASGSEGGEGPGGAGSGGAGSGGPGSGGGDSVGRCPGAGEGVLAGNSLISGVASVDAFFASVVAVDVAAQQVSNAIEQELDDIAASLGLPVGTGSAAIQAALEAEIAAHLEGELIFDFQPVRCVVSAADTLEAVARCDESVDPGSVSALCDGSCEVAVEGDGSVECGSEATVVCQRPVTDQECQGLCAGTCKFDSFESCAGTCVGSCDGSCAIEEANHSCNGPCDGACDGTCVLDAADGCVGTCTGQCTSTPSTHSCEVGDSALCAADAVQDEGVECSSACEGRVQPPPALAECEVSAKADTESAAVCAPPAQNVVFQFAEEIDAGAQSEFIAWLEDFKTSHAQLLSLAARAEMLMAVADDLADAASGSVRSSLQSADSPDAATAMGLACALNELPDVVGLSAEVGSRLSESLEANGDVVQVVSP